MKLKTKKFLKAQKRNVKNLLTAVTLKKPNFLKSGQGNNDDDFLTYRETKIEYDEETGEDPLNYYGFGVISYFELLKVLAVVFLILSLLHLPVINIYSSYHNYD